MNMKKMLIILLAASFAACNYAPAAAAAELSKADAIKLLTSMGYNNIVVAGVVNGIGGLGMGAFSSPNVAIVIAYGEKEGTPTQIKETFFYDKDLGWFYSEIDTEGRRVRVWTTTGYKVFKPAPNK